MKLVEPLPRVAGEMMEISMCLTKEQHAFLVRRGMPAIRACDDLSRIRAGQWLSKELPRLVKEVLAR